MIAGPDLDRYTWCLLTDENGQRGHDGVYPSRSTTSCVEILSQRHENNSKRVINSKNDYLEQETTETYHPRPTLKKWNLNKSDRNPEPVR